MVNMADDVRELTISVLKKRLEPSVIRKILKAEQKPNSRQKPVEWLVAETEHEGGKLKARLDKEELAEFLFDLYGEELLSVKSVRYQLAYRASEDERNELHEYSQASTRAPQGAGQRAQATAIAKRRWSPGGAWASYFVKALGLPELLSGYAGVPKEPDRLVVVPFHRLRDLEGFQKELKEKLKKALDSEPGKNRAVLSLPTGAGKTRTAVEGLLEWYKLHNNTKTILWLAHSEELCEQAVQSFRDVWSDQGGRHQGALQDSIAHQPLVIQRLWGGRDFLQDPDEKWDVAVASIQKLHAMHRKEEDDVIPLLAEDLGAVVVDEAHRLESRSYREVLEELGLNIKGRDAKGGPPLIGLTATPFRRNHPQTADLTRRFHKNLLHDPSLGKDLKLQIKTLQSKQVLSIPKHKVVPYKGPVINLDENEDFSNYYKIYNDYHPDFLRQLGEDQARNKDLLNELLALPENTPTLFFGCSVEHAKAMAVLLRRKSRTAKVVTGETRAATRRHLIEEFRKGRISVLCNYGVLTTGFDAPKIEAVVIGRPTSSALLYEQMIGRGLRGPLFGGTEACLVVDVRDNIRFRGRRIASGFMSHWKMR